MVLKSESRGMIFVGGVPQSEETGGIQENVSLGHKGFDRCPRDGSFLCGWA
jgi:hypothetical protein